MKEIKEESRCLASLAVFRELYNSEKDIYAIIGEFLRETISSCGKHQFTLTEIAHLLNETYDFKIPEAIINSALNRFKTSFTKYQGIYTIVDHSPFSNKGKLTGKHSEIQDSNSVIINDLFRFIEQEKKVKLSDNEKERVVQSFCSYIIEESTNQDYSDYISAFIVKGKRNVEFTQKLNTIKEGVVLYTGFKYNTNINELGSWDTDLTIFLDTEILFHFAGYNGSLCQTLFNDFISLINEINRTGKKKKGRELIHLKFFPEVQEEIESFFKKAEFIVSGRDKANPSKTAMTSIINGCRTPAEVIEKKMGLYTLLSTNSIFKDDYSNYYSENNHQYNIEDKGLLKEIGERTGIEDVASSLRFLNYINILRKGISNRGFENAGFMLLTETTHTLVIAWDEALKLNGSVPLASNLSFLTNKFWFKLNKGFGGTEHPKSFDIVTKAQIVLSAQLNDSVADKYEELQVKYKSGTLTEEQAAATIAELRRQARKPEDINEADVDEVLLSIEESSIENYLKEQQLFKDRFTSVEQENRKLNEKILEYEVEQKKREADYQASIKEKEEETRRKEEELENYRAIEVSKSQKRRKLRKLLKQTGIVFLVCLIIAGGILFAIFNDELFGMIAGAVSLVLAVISFLGFDYKALKQLFTRE